MIRAAVLAFGLLRTALVPAPPPDPAATPRAALASPTAAALPSVALPPELARVLADYESAWGRHDADALAGLFAEDGFVLAGGHPPARGRVAIRALYAGKGGPLALRALAYAVAGDVGYVIGAYAMARGAPDDGKFTLTLRRVDGRWLIFSDMDNGNVWRP